MKEERKVFTYVVTDGVGDEKVIIDEGHKLATTAKKAEKKVLADLESFSEDTDVLVAPFCGCEV